jgi:hypothetical protein
MNASSQWTDPPARAKSVRSEFTPSEIQAAVLAAAQHALREGEREGWVTGHDLYRAAGLI